MKANQTTPSEVVGPSGSVVAYEIDPDLAALEHGVRRRIGHQGETALPGRVVADRAVKDVVMGRAARDAEHVHEVGPGEVERVEGRGRTFHRAWFAVHHVLHDR